MSKINSKINPKSADFVSNAASMQAQVNDLNATIAKIRQGGGAKACDRHVSRGELLPRDRVQGLLDPGSPFLEFSALAAHDVYGEVGENDPAHFRVNHGDVPEQYILVGGMWRSVAFS